MTEPELPTVHAALASAMADVRALGKGDRNEHFNFSFRGIDAVVNAIGPVLRDHQLLMLGVLDGDVEYHQVPKGTEARLVMQYTFYGPRGDHLPPVRFPGAAFDSGDKAVTKAMSVAERTTLLHTFVLPTDERDPDADSPDYGEQRREQEAEQSSARKQYDAAVTAFVKAWESNPDRGPFDPDNASKRFGQDVRQANVNRLHEWTQQLTETDPAAPPEPPADPTPAEPAESASRESQDGETTGPAGPPPDTEPARKGQPPSQGQLARMHAMLNEQEITSDEDRHAAMSQFTGRTITSANQLTRREAAQFMDYLSNGGTRG